MELGDFFLWIRCWDGMDYTCTYPGTLARIESGVSELELLLLYRESGC